MSIDIPEGTVGVMVVRFQVPDLHEGHCHLIETAQKKHRRVLVILGSTGGMPTDRDPLSFEVRKAMVLARYPDVVVEEIFDHPLSPTFWSRNLDALLKRRCVGYTPILYGSRDSFLKKYSGIHETCEVPPISNVSGTDIRKDIATPTTREGREALIWQTQQRFPLNYRTVDLAITERLRVLLIRKNHHEGLCSFMGGFNDRRESDLAAVDRERKEEILGITTGPLHYIASVPVEDPRYRDSKDGVTTSFYRTQYFSGTPMPGDDADAVEWVHRDDLINRLVPWHQPLGWLLLAHHNWNH